MKTLPALPSLLALAMTLLPLTAPAQDAGADKPLGAYRDKNRLLLLFAPTAQDPAYLEQTKLWQGEKTGFDDRQLVTIPVLADARKPVAAESPAALAKKFGVDPKTFAVVLVGKDGHDAYRSPKPVPAATLYGVIDAMPMRRAEMRQQASPSPPRPSPTPAKPDLDHDE